MPCYTGRRMDWLGHPALGALVVAMLVGCASFVPVGSAAPDASSATPDMQLLFVNARDSTATATRPVRTASSVDDSRLFACRRVLRGFLERGAFTKIAIQASTPKPAHGGAARIQLVRDHVLILTVAHPSRTGAAAAFDSTLKALITALSSVGYVRGEFSLPWQAQSTDGGDGAQVGCPGVMLFRLFPLAKTRPKEQEGLPSELVVLIVTESMTRGLDQQEWSAAMDLVADAPPSEPDGKVPDESRLRVLGPFYSASMASMEALLHDKESSFALASGTLSRGCEAQGTFANAQFVSFAGDIDQRTSALHCFLKYDDPHCRQVHEPFDCDVKQCNADRFYYAQCLARHAIEYCAPEKGVSGIGNCPAVTPPQCGSAQADGYSKAIATLKASGSAFWPADHYSGFILEYPVNISALERDSSADAPRDKNERASAAPSDIVTPLDKPYFRVVHAVAIRDAANFLSAQGVNDVSIMTELAEDQVFLARQLKQELPDLRIAFRIWDRNFTRADYASELRGSLVIAAHSPVPNSKSQQPATVLSRDQDWGVYRAARHLLARCPRPLSKENPEERDSRCTQPPAASLYVISDGRFWPLAIHGQQISADAYADSNSLWVAWSLLAAMVLIGIVRCFTRPSKWWSRRTRKGSRPSRLSSFCASLWAALREPNALIYQPAFMGAVFLTLVLGCAAGWTVGWGMLVLTLGFCGLVRRWMPPRNARPERWLCETMVQGAAALDVAALALTAMTGWLLYSPLDLSTADAQLIRARALMSGVSPAAVVLVTCLLIQMDQWAHGTRLAPAVVSIENALPWEARLRLRRRSGRLGRDHCIANFVALVIVFSAAVFVGSRWSAREKAFTLEDPGLNAVLASCIVICGVLSLRAALLLIYRTRHLLNLLREITSAAFHERLVSAPVVLRTSIAHRFLVGSPGDLERSLASDELKSACKLLPETSCPADLEARARKVMRRTPHLLGKDAEQPKTALATFVAYGLATWLAHVRKLMWLATFASVSLVAATSGYVFGVRKLMVTVAVCITLTTVALSLGVFMMLERDEVLSRISETSPVKLMLHEKVVSALGIVVMPVLLALAAYYPGELARLLTWLRASGLPK